MATYMVKDELYTVDTWDINSVGEDTLRSAIVEKYILEAYFWSIYILRLRILCLAMLFGHIYSSISVTAHG